MRIRIKEVTQITSLNNTEQHYQQIIEALAPQGKLALIDDPQILDARPLKAKGISLYWGCMFIRLMLATHDFIAQNQLLTRVARLLDNKMLCTTLGEHYGTISAANLQNAHVKIETGRSIGKIVLEGF